jgi:hypothetical protein
MNDERLTNGNHLAEIRPANDPGESHIGRTI